MSIFTVESNIGGGKSTLLAELANLKFVKPHIVIQEKVKEWTELKNDNGEDILTLFYNDKEKYSYMFQSYVLFSRLHHILETVKENPEKIIICERSWLTDLYVFAKSLEEMKSLSDIEWKIYNLWHKQLKDLLKLMNTPLKMSGIIYLRTTPDVCYNRMHIRNRNAEKGVPLDYLKLLHEKHDNWLLERPKRREDVEWFSLHEDFITPVLTLDGDVDIWDCEGRDLQKKRIENFINYEITK